MNFLTNQFFLIAITFGVFFAAKWLQKRTGILLLNPILLTIAALIVFLKLTGVSYEAYSQGGRLIEFWLKPAVVALGVPLYLQLEMIRKQLLPILLSQLAGCLVGVSSVVLIAQLLGASPEVVLSLDRPVSEQVLSADGVAVENVTWTPEVEIRGNYFARTPTRGILVTTRRKVVIADNLFYRLPMSAVLMADGGGAYSHVGIVVDSAGVMMVAHAVPGEPDYEGDPDRVKLEPPERYYDAGRADRGCVMRCADSLTARRAAAKALGAYRRGALFDHDYDCSDTVRLYCCELVELAYAGAGMPIATLPRHNLSLPGLRLEGVILPSDFRSSPALRVIAEF